jgi:transketolase
MSIENLEAKYQACGWSVKHADGHNPEKLISTLKDTPFEEAMPSLLIAHTIKGKGVSFMENQAAWHHKVPNPEQLQQAMEELNSLEKV